MAVGGRGHHDDQRRRAGARLRLPSSRGAGPRARDDRPALRGPPRGRYRRRLEAPRLRPLGHPDGSARRSRVEPHDRAHHDPAGPARAARPSPSHGEHYRITDLAGHARSYRAGGPPFLIGGGAPAGAALRRELADIVGVNASIHSGEIDAAAAQDGAAGPHRREGRLGARRRGRPLRRHRVQRVAGRGRDHRRPRRASVPCSASCSAWIPRSGSRRRWRWSGTVDRGRRAARSERRERWGYSYHVIPGDKARDFAPVVARLTGT